MERAVPPAALLRSLGDTIERVEAVGRRLSGEQLVAAPVQGGWSPNEILWHMRATADVYGEHIARIMNEEQPRWRHVSPRGRMKKARYDQLPFAESFAAFARQRADLLAVLGGLAPGAWQRCALVFVPHNGRERRLTLQERVWGMANHEEIHCAEMEEVALAGSG